MAKLIYRLENSLSSDEYDIVADVLAGIVFIAAMAVSLMWLKL